MVYCTSDRKTAEDRVGGELAKNNMQKHAEVLCRVGTLYAHLFATLPLFDNIW